MGFWIFMLVMDLLVPLTMIGFGGLFQRKAPEEINTAYGYRTAMSMKNKETWKFAHEYFGRLWTRCGLILLPLSVIPLLFVLGKDADAVGTVGGFVCALQCIPLIAALFPTEMALKRNFDSDGNRQ